MNPNLFLAVLWLFVAVGLFTYLWANPDSGQWRLAGLGALLLVGYNLARWWMSRAYRNERAFDDQQEALRNRARYSTLKPTEEPPDPNFDFSKEPRPGEGEQKPGT